MLRRSRVALTALALAAAGLIVRADNAPHAVWVGSYTWQSDDPLLGGLSGITLFPGTQRFLTLSDRGRVFAGELVRDADGRVISATAGPGVVLRGYNGNPLTSDRADSEDIVLDQDGSVLVSFEGGFSRIERYRAVDAIPERMPRAQGFDAMDSNASLESVAIDPSGAILTLPEKSSMPTRPFPVYRFCDGKWDQPFSIPRDGRWLATSATFGPDGKFYLLERDFWGFIGFLSRVRRFDYGPDGFTNGRVLFQTRARVHDNLEGLAVWRDDAGAIRLTMISDDNFSMFQRTEFVDYRVTEPTAP